MAGFIDVYICKDNGIIIEHTNIYLQVLSEKKMGKVVMVAYQLNAVDIQMLSEVMLTNIFFYFENCMKITFPGKSF